MQSEIRRRSCGMNSSCDWRLAEITLVLTLIIVGGMSTDRCRAADVINPPLVNQKVAPQSISQYVSQADSSVRRAEAAFMQNRISEAVDRYRVALGLLDNALAAPVRGDSEERLQQRARTLRQKTLYSLARVLRRQGEHAEALGYALRDHEELMQRDDPLLQLTRQKSAVGIITDLIALSDYQRASEMLAELRQRADLYGPLKDVQRIFCVAMQAIISEQTSSDDLSAPRWREVGTEATRMLARIAESRGRLSDLWEPTHALLVASADALSKRDDHQAADYLLTKFTLRKNEAGLRSFLSRMALLSILRRDFGNAERYLHRALPLAGGTNLNQRLAKCQILSNLAMCLNTQQRYDEAATYWSKSAVVYESCIAEVQKEREAALPGLLIQLAGIYRRLERYDRAQSVAQQLLDYRLSSVGENQPLTVEARAGLATTMATGGGHSAARPLLESVVKFWREQSRSNATALARTLSNLGAVEKALGNATRARELFNEALQLQKERLKGKSASPILAIAYSNHAGSLLDQGRYIDAVQQYEQVLRLCDELGSRAASLKTTTLLNLANAYRSQGQFERSLEFAREAYSEYVQTSDHNSSGAVPYLKSLAAVYRATGQFPLAYEKATEALNILRRQKHQQPLLTASVQATLASVCDLGGVSRAAELHWKTAQSIYEAQHQPLPVARILNRRAVIALAEQRNQAAEKLLTTARQLLDQMDASTIDLHNVLANQAEVQRRLGDHTQANRTLARALAVLEQPRQETSGAEAERAQFLVRFGSAYDKAIDWAIEDGKLADAFSLSERRRSRTLLDEFRASGVSLRQVTLDSDGRPVQKVQQLLDEEEKLRAEISRIQQRLFAGDSDESSDTRRSEIEKLLADRTKRYREVVTELRSRNPACRELLRNSAMPVNLDEFRSLIGENQLALVWLIGQNSGHVFAIGHSPEDTRSFRLEINATLPQWVDVLVQHDGKSTVRGIERTTTVTGDQLSETAAVSRDFNIRKCARFVEWYRLQIQQRKSFLKRPDSGEESAWISGVNDATFQRVTGFSEAVLPTELRKWVAERKPDSLIIIPDGPLHRLPLEALVVRNLPDSNQPAATEPPEAKHYAYALEALPTMMYAASASLLAELHERRGQGLVNGQEAVVLARSQAPDGEKKSGAAAVADARPKLLIVGNPTYPKNSQQLPTLPGTETECRAILSSVSGGTFEPVLLLGDEATERATREQLVISPFIHLAAHGLVDETAGNLFGAIALTAPRSESTEGAKTASDRPETGIDSNDGFLTYGEIAALDLSRCKLAVLSACRTFDGPRRPMEAGSSLAQVFLSAGARNVIASHWNVDDRSTAELMKTFYAVLLDGQSAKQSGMIASTLRAARLTLLLQTEWQAPWFWAPFVSAGRAR